MYVVDGPGGHDDSPPSIAARADADGDVVPPIAMPRQPIPRDTVVLHEGGSTKVSRLWDDREEAVRYCRLCPKDACFVSPGGMCLVKIDGFVPTVLAPLRPTLSAGLAHGMTATLRIDGARRQMPHR